MRIIYNSLNYTFKTIKVYVRSKVLNILGQWF